MRKVPPLRYRYVKRCKKKAGQAVWMSADWMRFTPASVICFQAAASEPLRSMPRVASSIT